MFKLKSDYKPQGDQPKAIEKIVSSLKSGNKFQTLLGITGSGKTFTVANIIQQFKKPVLVIAPNKSLAAQLYREYKNFFPQNNVNYFVSYYDYYQPEAYLPGSDTYIEKEAMINEEIDKLRHKATSALMTRKDVIIISSVSCIYNLGLPSSYLESALKLEIGRTFTRGDLIRQLIKIQFERTNGVLERGKFRVRGDVFEIMPAFGNILYLAEIENQKIIKISLADSLTKEIIEELEQISVFPAKHFVADKPGIKRAIKEIRKELKERLDYFEKNKMYLEAQRLERRTRYDLEMLASLGYCHGIENYSRLLTNKPAGEAPETLLSYFPKNKKGGPDFLLVIDESHIALPQIRGMYEGDRSRKQNLVDYGWRLPSALDNRPLKFEEFLKRIGQVIFTTATPGKFEMENSSLVVEQVIRPTGLVDPEVDVRPVSPGNFSSLVTPATLFLRDEGPGKAGVQSGLEKGLDSRLRGNDKEGGEGNNNYPGQIQDLIGEIKKAIKNKGRVIANTLTKKMAEDLQEFLQNSGFKSRYLHSDVKTIERVDILKNFRQGAFDVLIGVNLLREGLDLPEVELVAILDADREGFLRSESSLIQTMGRASRNVKGKVVLYADEITGSIKKALEEVSRRRQKQIAHNKKYKIIPKTISKKIEDFLDLEGSENKKIVPARPDL